MLIRPARPEELVAVGELTLAAYADYEEAQGDYADELRAADERALGADLVVAVADDGDLLGTVTFCLPGSPWSEIAGPDEAEFRMLAVAANARGKGVGAHLVRWCIDRARERGCTALALSSATSMTAAHRIYQRMGFVRTPDRDWSPTERVQLEAFRLDLTA